MRWSSLALGLFATGACGDELVSPSPVEPVERSHSSPTETWALTRLDVAVPLKTIILSEGNEARPAEPGERAVDAGEGLREEALDAETVRGYRLPFAAGVSCGVMQYPHAYNAKLWHAIDFALPRSSTVVAMRAGTVSALVDYHRDYSSSAPCTVHACNDATNFIILQHDDGNESAYLHIAYRSASALELKVGSTVCQGQPIGKVGYNGFTTAPHLHVSVQAGGSAGPRDVAWDALFRKETKPIAFDDVSELLVKGAQVSSGNVSSCESSTGT